jgi:hypothetical protein
MSVQTAMRACFDQPHVPDHVDGLREADDRITHQLAGAVPGDLAPAIDVDDRRAVGGSVLR